ncbi:hypothetical protein R6Y95_02740 [Methanoculleus palmolei]|uniref:Uncharacterized protein n=1 Tax=Methanoculleus palmolei TaxID=72612 RepID=A0ABD8A9R6_9EURY|nr:hypothetical protein R6Y95_02740 [Methanoculleus palmolei]
MTQKKSPHIRPVLMALLLAAMVAVPAVSAYWADDFTTSEKDTYPTRIYYYAETHVTEVMDEIYIQANLWYRPNSASPSDHVESTPMEHYYNLDNAGAYGTYGSDSAQPEAGQYQARSYRALVENGVVSKSWFNQDGWTIVP